MPPKPGCVVILVHGIGNQKKDWSQEFRKALRAELGAKALRVKLDDAYWAPLSTMKELFRPTLAAGPSRAIKKGLEAEIFDRTRLEFSRLLAAEAGAPAGIKGFGPGDISDWVKGALGSAYRVVEDVGNYIARNGVRTAVQNVVHAKLGEAERSSVPVVLISHSQGTVICYDVLRQSGSNYPHLRTWITMGSPLRKYFGFFQWGRQQLGMPSDLRWMNLYDIKDIVGKDLKGAVDWSSPSPEDFKVDNRRHAGNAHDHWHNQETVKVATGEIRRLFP